MTRHGGNRKGMNTSAISWQRQSNLPLGKEKETFGNHSVGTNRFMCGENNFGKDSYKTGRYDPRTLDFSFLSTLVQHLKNIATGRKYENRTSPNSSTPENCC